MKNNSIALLMLVLIIVLFFSLFTFPKGITFLSGRAVTASTSFNISEEISLLVTGSVNFAGGRVFPNATKSILYSEFGYVFFNWYNVSQTGSAPSGRFGQVVYHQARKTFIFYGSRFNETTYETWEFNRSNNKWSQLSTTKHPNATRSFGMVYDASIGEVILFGGLRNDTYSSSPKVFNETWKLNSSLDWQLLSTTGTPGRIAWPAMAYDSDNHMIILFGGYDEKLGAMNSSNKTWKFNAATNTWTDITSSIVGAPSKRFASAMAYDNVNNQMILFGGYWRIGFPYSTHEIFFNDTWEFNGTHWNDISSLINDAPPATRAPSMVYDVDRERIVLINGDHISSSQANSGVTNPRCAGLPGDLNYDGFLDSQDIDFAGEMIGGDIPSTFCLDMDGDGLISPGDTSALSSLVYQTRNVDFYNETWEFNGTHWFKTAHSLFWKNKRASIAYDSLNKSVMVFYGTGYEDNYLQDDIWRYEGSVFDTDDGSGACINGTWFFPKQFLSIENDGTVNVSVNYSADKNAAEFIGGTSPKFEIRGVNVSQETGACVGLNESYAEVPKNVVSEKLLCPLLKFGNSKDRFRVSVKLTVPNNIEAGERTSTITFSATIV